MFFYNAKKKDPATTANSFSPHPASFLTLAGAEAADVARRARPFDQAHSSFIGSPISFDSGTNLSDVKVSGFILAFEGFEHGVEEHGSDFSAREAIGDPGQLYNIESFGSGL